MAAINPLKVFPLLLLILIVMAAGCKKKDDFVNPFDDPSLQPPEDSVTVLVLEPNNFEGIHQNVFRATCANSGCHDGTFEPDFRSVEAAYNTLVYQPVIKNDAQNSFEYRVLPGDADASVLMTRLLIDIDGQSGVMPLEVDPGSDFIQKRAQYLENIRTWINNGAPDMMGNLPVLGNNLPQMIGAMGFAGGNPTRLVREPGKNSINVPPGTTDLELWFAISDAETNTGDLTHNKIRYSESLNGFGTATELPLDLPGSMSGPGYLGDQVDYYHRVMLDVSSYTPGTVLFFRLYVQDSGPSITEIPSDASADYVKEYASIIIK
jgi:hypothetical protein